MKEKFHSVKTVLAATAFLLITFTLSGQTGIMEELRSNSVRNQFEIVENRTRIYDNFRAVREDVFQVLKKNTTDTLNAMQQKIQSLNRQVADLNGNINSLNENLNSTKAGLDEMTKARNSISFLGIPLEKAAYNSIMWSIIIILLLLLAVGFMVFRRNQKVVVQRNKDLQELKDEFEGYRKTSREAREKMALQHFNELKKLRGE